MNRCPYRLFALTCALLLPVVAARADETAQVVPPQPSPEIDELVAFVRRAGELVTRQGEAAFPLLRQKGGEWYRGDRYVFVNDLRGDIVVDPNRPEFEGTNQLRLRDPDGKPVIALMIEEVTKNDHEGWVHYLWPKYALSEPYWKSSFVIRVTAPSGKEYIVGSGLYDVKNQSVFVVDTVQEAANLVAESGPAAYDEFRDPAGPYLYGNTYVFVIDGRGSVLCNPAAPSFEGKSLVDYQSEDGRYPFREMRDATAHQSTAWVQYKWPTPDMPQPKTKFTFVKKVDYEGETLYVGSGLYLD